MKLYFSQIDKIKRLGLFDENLSKIVDCFLMALNDWPNELFTFEDFEHEVGKLINAVPDKANLNLYLDSVNYSKKAWEAESLSQLIEVFDFYDQGVTLKMIVQDINERINSFNLEWQK